MEGKNAPALILLILTIISAASIIINLENYQVSYWQARSAILDTDSNSTNVNSVTVIREPSTNLTTVTVVVSAFNPTDYSGLILQRYDLVIFFAQQGNRSENIFGELAQSLLVSKLVGQPLPPYSTVTTTIALQLTSAQAKTFQDFNSTYPGQVDAVLYVTTVVNSFLDPVLGRLTPVKEQEIPIN